MSYAFGDLTLSNFKTGLVNGTAVVNERVNWSSLAGAPTHFVEHILWGPRTGCSIPRPTSSTARSA